MQDISYPESIKTPWRAEAQQDLQEQRLLNELSFDIVKLNSELSSLDTRDRRCQRLGYVKYWRGQSVIVQR